MILCALLQRKIVYHENIIVMNVLIALRGMLAAMYVNYMHR